MIPATVYGRIQKSLLASLSLVEYLAEQGYTEAGRDIAEIRVALAWLSQMENGQMGERLENGQLISDKLSVIRGVCGVLADDLRNRGGDERRARGILMSLVFAIENDSLDSLFKTVQPWTRAEVARVDAAKPVEFESVGPFTVVAAFEMERPTE